MSVIRLELDAVEALEHAMEGVQTIGPRRIERGRHARGLIRIRSAVQVGICGDTPVDHEVTVVMHRLHRRRRRR